MPCPLGAIPFHLGLDIVLPVAAKPVERLDLTLLSICLCGLERGSGEVCISVLFIVEDGDVPDDGVAIEAARIPPVVERVASRPLCGFGPRATWAGGLSESESEVASFPAAPGA